MVVESMFTVVESLRKILLNIDNIIDDSVKIEEISSYSLA